MHVHIIIFMYMLMNALTILINTYFLRLHVVNVCQQLFHSI